jgi:hypothetical protein
MPDEGGDGASRHRQVNMVDGHDLAECAPHSDGLNAAAVPFHRHAAFAENPEISSVMGRTW